MAGLDPDINAELIAADKVITIPIAMNSARELFRAALKAKMDTFVVTGGCCELKVLA